MALEQEALAVVQGGEGHVPQRTVGADEQPLLARKVLRGGGREEHTVHVPRRALVRLARVGAGQAQRVRLLRERGVADRKE
jgi:hypothetical protein